MLLAQQSAPGLFIDVGVIVFLFATLIVGFLLRRRTKDKIKELESRAANLEANQADILENLDDKISRLKEIINTLVMKLNDSSKKINAILETNETIRAEIDRKVKPLKASLDDTAAKFGSTHDSMRKRIQQSSNELERMAQDITAFADEIQRMRDFIRERTIDLEL
ncbi:MAG: hypothetical protein JSU72_07780 [Deltaproteobacteria bacterium]|nr:MAG: hypothetical protein JSU72_07780 [Deltaproteobacteria bacterium]